MATQVQIRGANNATQSTRTLASRELDINLTNERVHYHDGSTVGGIPMGNIKDDIQKQRAVYVSATGTNSLTASLSPAPASYSAGLTVILKAQSTNTGAVTINLNSLGAKNLNKKTPSGLAALESGDLQQNGLYEIVYDGTQFQVMSLDSTGITTVSQGDLNTLTSSTNLTGIQVISGGRYSLSGGEYGFYPQFRELNDDQFNTSFEVLVFGGPAVNTNVFGTYLFIQNGQSNASSFPAASFRQRYVSSSPPYNMGDGDVHGFIYAKVNKGGDFMAWQASDVPPWAYNGPTNTKASHVCRKTGKKYRKVMKERTIEEVLQDKPCEYELQLISHQIKNADMNLIPQPFLDVNDDETVVLLDPMDKRIGYLMEYQNAGNNLDEFYEKLKIDNEALKRKGPNGVLQVKFEV